MAASDLVSKIMIKIIWTKKHHAFLPKIKLNLDDKLELAYNSRLRIFLNLMIMTPPGHLAQNITFGMSTLRKVDIYIYIFLICTYQWYFPHLFLLLGVAKMIILIILQLMSMCVFMPVPLMPIKSIHWNNGHGIVHMHNDWMSVACIVHMKVRQVLMSIH